MRDLKRLAMAGPLAAYRGGFADELGPEGLHSGERRASGGPDGASEPLAGGPGTGAGGSHARTGWRISSGAPRCRLNPAAQALTPRSFFSPRRCRTVEIQAGDHAITAAEPMATCARPSTRSTAQRPARVNPHPRRRSADRDRPGTGCADSYVQARCQTRRSHL